MSSWRPLDPGQGFLGLGRRPALPRPPVQEPPAQRPALRIVPAAPPVAAGPDDQADDATAPTIPAPPATPRASRPPLLRSARGSIERSTIPPDTHRGLVLCAAGLLADGTARDVAIEDLVVRAWELAPEAFGLRGHPHPDSNRVVSKIYGAQSLLGLHLLTAGGAPRSVALTPAGVAWWRSIGRPWLEGRAR